MDPAVRVIAGAYRGRRLETPADAAIRPTSDRVREAVFSILSHGAPALSLDGVAVIDLFAGTGALGIEALSRGAVYALFVDSDASARGLIRTNIEGLGLGGITRIFRRDATDLGPCTHKGGFGLAFLDPPYGQGLGERALASLDAGGWLQEGAVVVLEERADSEIALPAAFTLIERRAWGDTEVRFLRYRAPAP